MILDLGSVKPVFVPAPSSQASDVGDPVTLDIPPGVYELSVDGGDVYVSDGGTVGEGSRRLTPSAPIIVNVRGTLKAASAAGARAHLIATPVVVSGCF